MVKSKCCEINLVFFSQSYATCGVVMGRSKRNFADRLTPTACQMLISLIAIAAVYVVGLLVLAAACLRAPEGFEDDKGFHKGRVSLTDDPSL